MRLTLPLGLWLALLTAACGTLEVGLEPTSTPLGPTATTNSALPTHPSLTPTQPAAPTTVPVSPVPSAAPIVSANPLPGTWQSLTTADGFCTDYPLFIGGAFIGTSTTQVCHLTDVGNWTTLDVPQGTRVTAINQFPPGGGLLAATDVGQCSFFGEWQCQTGAEGFPYAAARQIVPLGPDPVYRLADEVVYKDQRFGLPVLVGAVEAEPTWLAVSGEFFGAGFLAPEIWVGTNGYGVVVIDPSTGASRQYTTADGLPSNTIRDVQTERCPKTCDYREVWVATDQGVARWDGAQWTAYTLQNGLPAADVRGVASHARNTVWVATAQGAAYFNGTTWQALANTATLPTQDFTGVTFINAQTIAFGTLGHGLLFFTP